MSTETPLLTHMVWLVALQFLLYATGWLLSSLLLREERAAVLCWAGFMAGIGTGFLVISQRGEPRSWLAFNGSGLVFIGGLLLLWAGLVAFYRHRAKRRELLITFGVLALLLGAIDPGLEQAPWRVLLTYGANMWVVVRAVSTLHPLVVAEHGRRVSWLLAGQGVLIVAAFAIPFTRQLLNMDRPLEIHRFDDTNLRSLYVFIVTAAIFNFGFMAMVTHRLLGRLRELSHRDALTGLYNRRAIEQDLQREWRRWRRRRDGFALLVLDLDHFKRINDSHGHAAGDEVLVQTARRLTARARDTDTVARTGGEEFLVLMPGTDLAGAARAGERMLAQLREQPVAWNSTPLPVTASIGVAQVEKGDDDIAAVLARADQALYRAKAEGRDRVVLSA